MDLTGFPPLRMNVDIAALFPACDQIVAAAAVGRRTRREKYFVARREIIARLAAWKVSFPGTACKPDEGETTWRIKVRIKGSTAATLVALPNV